jgi:RimJ/RimL family protein N-acetyltransferase
MELLRGEGVTLVPVPAGAHLDALEELTGGRDVGRGWPTDATGQALAFAGQGGWTWLVVDADGRVVGECGTKGPPVDGQVEIGYGLAAPSRAAGLGTAAVRTLLAWLAARPEIDSVLAYVAIANTPSRRLVERLGFTAVAEEAGEIVYRKDLAGAPDSDQVRCT